MTPLSKISGHVHNCKCDGCREMLRIYNRKRRAAQRAAKSRENPQQEGATKKEVYSDGCQIVDLKPGELPGVCWCGKKVVALPAKHVRDGITVSCGKKGCGS